MERYLAIIERWPLSTWNSPKSRALYQARRLRKFESDSAGKLVILKTRSELQQFVAHRRPYEVGMVLGAEGAQPLEGNFRKSG